MKAVVYVRVSTEEQGRGYSIITQLEQCREYCARQGYEVVDEFSDEFSGMTRDRPGINALLETVVARPPDVVVAWELDRLLGRDELGQVLIKHEILNAGARIEYSRDGSGHTLEPTDSDLLTGFKALIARQENADRIERIRRGQRGRVAAGNVLISGTGAPYGFDYVSAPHVGKLVVNVEEAAVVRDAYAWLITEGLSTYAIARRLHGLGIPTRGDQCRADGRKVRKESGLAVWNPSTVTKILTSTVYRGEWVYGTTRRVKRRDKRKPNGDPYKTGHKKMPVDPSEWITVIVPAIVDEATWNRAQEQLAENKRFAKPTTREYLLRSLIFCSECGTRWTGAQKYYRCAYNGGRRRPWARTCDSRKIRVDTLEGAVWNHVTGYLLHPDRLMTNVDQRRREEAAERACYERKCLALDAQLATIDRRLSELLTQALDGFPTEIVQDKKRELLDQRVRLRDERQRMEAEQSRVTVTPDVEAMLRDLSGVYARALPLMTFEEKRQLLRVLRVRVDVLDHTQIRVSGVLSSAVLIIPD